MSNDNVMVQGVTMTAAAAMNVEECSVDVLADAARMQRGLTVEALLSECLDGADADRVQGWREYVEAVADVDTCNCHGCGETVVRGNNAHNGESYCDECEAAPVEE